MMMIVVKPKPNASTSASHDRGQLRPYRGLYSSGAGPESKLRTRKLLGLMREGAYHFEHLNALSS